MTRTIQTLCIVLALTLFFPLWGGCLAEEAPLPTLSPVAFPQDRVWTVPENGKKNYQAKESNYGSDGLSYHDDSLDVRLHLFRLHDTDIVVAFAQIASPEQLRTELSHAYPSQTTMPANAIARRVRAVLAVNADWFTYHNAGIIYRNGKLLRDRPHEEYDGLAIDQNGDFHIVSPLTEEGFAAIQTPIFNSFAFGPALVIDGEVQEIRDRKETFKQRLAVGQVGPLSYVLVATGGPETENSVGLSIPQLARLMKDLGAVNAYNFDGGQSTCLMLDQKKINAGELTKMRFVGDILYFTTAVPD